MSRLIDADALKELFSEVIGHIAKKPEMNGNLEHMIRASAMVIQMIDDAPTVQPETNCSEFPNNSDTISRQAAIDAICKACSMEGDYHKCDGYPETSTWCDELVALRALPSAQPERTCVNCGRTVNNGGWYADGRTRCPIEEHYALPKDGYCHLWEKRNVTDDDYPERREE